MQAVRKTNTSEPEQCLNQSHDMQLPGIINLSRRKTQDKSVKSSLNRSKLLGDHLGGERRWWPSEGENRYAEAWDALV